MFAMRDSKSKEVERFLNKADIHQQFTRNYRTAENENFFDQAFTYLTNILNAPKNSTFLDVGCGSCAHSLRLARRGFFVQAVDLSEWIIERARENVKTSGLEKAISIQRANILSLPYKDRTFSYILCWGVLMHIPELEKALSELVRVLKSGGMLIISENNRYSFHAVMKYSLKRLFHLGKASVKETTAGIEYWYTGTEGSLLVRQTDIGWLIRALENRQLIVKTRVCGQFTDLYTEVSSRHLKNLIHGFNNFWFKYVKSPYPAAGNIVIFQKEG